jgi:hypothetical protein
MLADSVTTVSDSTYGYVGASGVTRAVTYNSRRRAARGQKAVEGGAGTQRVGICQACHAATNDTLLAPTAWTKYWRPARLRRHRWSGGSAPVTSAHKLGSAAVPYCVSCHTHGTGFGGECIGCHATTQPITQGRSPGRGAGARS